jgi:hypothetical protein
MRDRSKLDIFYVVRNSHFLDILTRRMESFLISDYSLGAIVDGKEQDSIPLLVWEEPGGPLSGSLVVLSPIHNRLYLEVKLREDAVEPTKKNGFSYCEINVGRMNYKIYNVNPFVASGVRKGRNVQTFPR